MFKNVKKLFSVLCVGAGALALASCGENKVEESKTWQEGGTITFEDVKNYSNTIKEASVSVPSFKQIYECGYTVYEVDVTIDYKDVPTEQLNTIFDTWEQNDTKVYSTYCGFWNENENYSKPNVWWLNAVDKNNNWNILGDVSISNARSLTYDAATNGKMHYNLYDLFTDERGDYVGFVFTSITYKNLPENIKTAATNCK